MESTHEASADSTTLSDLVDVRNYGTLCLVFPLTEPAQDWLSENTDGMWMSGGLVVEPRYAGDLLFGMAEEFGVVR